jgi:hypothetical protein
VCHALVALPLVIGGKPKRERKPRRKSTRTLIEAAKRADLYVTALNPDGSISTGKADDEPAPINGNPWDEVLHGDR